jgi:pimeloyl-ACP methyl ester carboxylesterase
MPPARTTTRLLAGTAAAAATAGIAASLRRGDPGPDPAADHGLGSLHGRELTVTTSDGVRLHVEELGPDDAPVTVVLAHGYTHHRHAWHYQARHLSEEIDAPARVLVYDHRGHGRSDASPHGTATIEQLGHDLAQVIAQCAPTGPLVLGGHSMGGMTLMAFAEQYPDLVRERVAGVALVGTSSGGLAEVTHGLPAPLVPLVRWALPRLNERRRRQAAAGKKPPAPSAAGTRRLLFGTNPSAAQVSFVAQLTADCSADTVADFYYTFENHDRGAALAAFREIPVLIVAGGKDALCPEAHSRTMAQLLPDAELVVYPDAGHMVHFEHHDDVNARLARFVQHAIARATAAA